MVLKKDKRKSNKTSNWHPGSKEIKECNFYKYLGVIIKFNGSFSEHVNIIEEKAGKAYFTLINKCREFDGLQPSLFLYLFDQTIVPILNYASEILGFDEHVNLE